MRFMILVKSTAQSESGALPDEKSIAAMADYHEQLARAGVLLDASGLQASDKGWRIRCTNGKRTLIGGPFPETNELVAGYTIIQVRSREEALEWTRRFPPPSGEDADGEIEVRQMFEPHEFGDSRAADRFREVGAGGAGERV